MAKAKETVQKPAPLKVEDTVTQPIDVEDWLEAEKEILSKFPSQAKADNNKN